MKRIVFLVFILFSHISLSQSIQADACEPANPIARLWKQIDDFLWTPNFDSKCDPKKVPTECLELKQELLQAKKDWKAYLEVCQKENEFTKHAFSCTQSIRKFGVQIEDMWLMLADDTRKDMDRKISDQQCSQNMEEKQRIFEKLNANVPQLLQIKDGQMKKNLLSRSCSEIRGFILNYQREMRVKASVTYAEPVNIRTVSAEGLEFLIWKKSLTTKPANKQSIYDLIEKHLVKANKNFHCLSTYRKNEVICANIFTMMVPLRKGFIALADTTAEIKTKKMLKEKAARNSNDLSYMSEEESITPILKSEVLNKIELEYTTILKQEKKILEGKIGQRVYYDYMGSAGKSHPLEGHIKSVSDSGFVMEISDAASEKKLIMIPFSASYQY